MLDFVSSYVSGFDLLDELLYHVAVPISTEGECQPDDTYSWYHTLSDKHLYEAAT